MQARHSNPKYNCMHQAHLSLDVGVVVAGIAGLSAAIALTRAGHRGEVFERSTFANEIGAATSIYPNASRILKSWNFDFDTWNPSECTGQHALNGNLEALTSGTYDFEAKYGSKFYLCHRVDLHTGLRHPASQCGPVLRLSAPIESIEFELQMLHVGAGDCHRKNLIVVAEGLHVRISQPYL
jgi:salicylate hydroxylase